MPPPPDTPLEGSTTASLTAAAKRIAALSRRACEEAAGVVSEVLGVGPILDGLDGVEARMSAALEVAQMDESTVALQLRLAEQIFGDLVETRGWMNVLEVNPESPARIVARVATLRARQKEIRPPHPQMVVTAPPEETKKSTELSQVAKLLPGDLAEVAILSGPWLGEYVDCTIHKRSRGGASFTVHVLPTKRFDSAVGNSGALVENVPHHFLRIKKTPRILRGGLYMSVDDEGRWWPVSIKDEATDGTYTVSVRDGAFGRIWEGVFAANIYPLDDDDVGSPTLPPGAKVAGANDADMQYVDRS